MKEFDTERFPPDPWRVRETGLDLGLIAQTESIFALANGHLGLRGNLDEGEPRGLSGTYLNGLYESYPLEYGERGFGFAEDGQAVVNVTDGKIIRLLVEDEPFDVHRGHLEHHERTLDFRTGILTREVQWRSEAGYAVRVRSRRLVSFVDRSVAAISYEVEALERPMRVALQSNLHANQVDRPANGDPRAGRALGDVLDSELHIDHGLRVVLAHRTKRTKLGFAAGMEHVIDAQGEVNTLTQSEPDLGRVTMAVELHPGRPLTLTKLLSYHWSSRQTIDWLRDQVDASLESAVAQGFDVLAERQRAFLDDYWQGADIELDGDPEIQQALRFAQFHLVQASARAEGRAIAAKGLTGPGYDGHAFWDTEGFVLPVLIHTMPGAAREALRWRHWTLPLARERAAQLGLKGAALPWRTIHGEECSGYWPAGTAAFHVNADVAWAVDRYVAATGDDDFLAGEGLALLVDTARLWAHLGHHGADGCFHIHGVTGPDEYSAIVDDNIYTNLMAARNLRAAADAAAGHRTQASKLGVVHEEIDSWRKAADTIYIPFDERLGIHPQDGDFLTHDEWDFAATPPGCYPLLLHYPYFELYRKQVIKQADLVLALHVAGEHFTLEEKRAAFEYYETLTVRDSSLSACTQAVVAAEVGHIELAYDYLAEAAFMDIRDLEHNVADGVHMASLAGAVTAAIAGLGGAREIDRQLVFRPRLPRELERLVFRITFGGVRVRVEVGQEDARYVIDSGHGVTIEHYGEPVELQPGAEPVALPIPPAERLTRPRQPPGREPMRWHERMAAARGVSVPEPGAETRL
ncbi:glycoside hydrolase family 65 protein [Capillimicrobium parvum]|uniref:Glycosyl hydrolase n=1 Tax=Capillimicrobium parvum TaxID=2884022 RepID=A0A9E7C0Y6_9ACTN|nr:glycosyl hydrolase family 65 protein [Capillimicrobium parvum]UGS35878.1 putative glycosyl hydrolase [Capillimicrobium parvum]